MGGAPLEAELRELSDLLDAPLEPATFARGVLAWTAMYGLVSFEVFGQFNNVLVARDAFFRLSLTHLSDLTGLTLNTGGVRRVHASRPVRNGVRCVR